jgi:N-formylglutamate amidohydrolase
MHKFASFGSGESQLVALAVHDGHDLRPEVAEWISLDEATRRREEDPFTGNWTTLAPNWGIVHRSRFEVDVNRPREGAVYRRPADAWGLDVWRPGVPAGVWARSLDLYDGFYAQLRDLLDSVAARHPRFVVLDLHTYNQVRDGASTHVDAQANPEVNIGTGTMNRTLWNGVVDRFIADLRNFDFLGRRLDVRENVRFQGGYIPRWIHANYPQQCCAIAVEVRKFFMDEWSGVCDEVQYAAVYEALAATVPGLLEEIGA